MLPRGQQTPSTAIFSLQRATPLPKHLQQLGRSQCPRRGGCGDRQRQRRVLAWARPGGRLSAAGEVDAARSTPGRINPPEADCHGLGIEKNLLTARRCWMTHRFRLTLAAVRTRPQNYAHGTSGRLAFAPRWRRRSTCRQSCVDAGWRGPPMHCCARPASPPSLMAGPYGFSLALGQRRRYCSS